MSRTYRIKNKYIAAKKWGEQTIERAAMRYMKFHNCTYEHALAKMHKESGSSKERSPSHYHRITRERKLRTYNKQQIRVSMLTDLENAICKENPDSCLWDWS